MLKDSDLDGVVIRNEGESDAEYASRRAVVLVRLNALKRAQRPVFACAMLSVCLTVVLIMTDVPSSTLIIAYVGSILLVAGACTMAGYG